MALLGTQAAGWRRHRRLDPAFAGRHAAISSYASAIPALWITAAALIATLGLASAGWVLAIKEMNGMDMGVATRLGSFPSFLAVWIPMMAAMMLPGAAPAVMRDAQAHRRLRVVPLFVGLYLAVWALVGIAVFAVYRPHGATTAGLVAIAAGVYEFTPLKQRFRRRCHELRPHRIRFGADCVGSSIGLMLTMVALGIMSVGWMAVVAVIGVAQKLLPTTATLDVPLALAIVGLGVLILLAPSAVPGLTPAM